MSDRLDAARTPEERERLCEIDERLACRATKRDWERQGGRYVGIVDSDTLPAPIAEFDASEDAELAAHCPADLAYLRALLDERDGILSDARDDAPTPWRELGRLRRQVAVMRAALTRIGTVSRSQADDADDANKTLAEVDRAEDE